MEKLLTINEAKPFAGVQAWRRTVLEDQGAAKNVFFEESAKDFIETYAKPNKRLWQRDQISVDHLVLFFKGKYLAGINSFVRLL